MTIFKSVSVVFLSAAILVGCQRNAPESVNAAEVQAKPAKPAAATAKPRLPTDPQQPASPSPATVAPATPTGQPAANAQGSATLEFHNRIKEYLKIHNEAETKVPNLKNTNDPAQISEREAALAKTIQTLRAGAKLGDIFAPEYQPYFIKIVQDDFATRSAAARKAIIVELPKNMKVDINTVYPTTLPLATFPPMLLRKLPDLPPELEYRLVGRSLILRDVKANLIVDILRDVVPTIPS
ncbi:MAG: hypothetical protein Q7R30_19525 [Acidobacteriota bacterium]|nr:hypothetical protein [Acidobacteriota bacterium]